MQYLKLYDMKATCFYFCVAFVLHTLAHHCPVPISPNCEVSEEDESTCYHNKDCRKGQLCCPVGCIKECINPVNKKAAPPSGEPAIKLSVRRPIKMSAKKHVTKYVKRRFPKNVRICYTQSHCRRHQCCTNPDPGATIGLCQNRRRVAYKCHNPRLTGEHRVWCPGPAGIVHPDLCPCGCGDFCAVGPSPRRNSHGGYIGICSFG